MARRIILLSDGTGNSSAKIWRANVWRTFEALGLSGSNQVAFYDDGVGTSSFKPWAILGVGFCPDPPPTGPRVERHLLVKRARMAGLLVFDYQHRYEEAVARLAEWVRQGRLRYREDIVDGIEKCSGAIAELYRGENLGKRLIRLSR